MVAPPTVVDAARSNRRLRWLWRGALAIVVVLMLGALAAVITVRVAFSGRALASRVCAQMNADMRGRVSIASIDWPMSAMPRVIRGGWVPVTLRDVEVRDADGVVVFRSPLIRAELDAHAVLFGPHDVIARGVAVDRGEVRLRELLAAFESPARRIGASAHEPRGARIDVRDFDVHGVSVAIDSVDRGHIDLAWVCTRGSLFYDPRRAEPLLTYAVAPFTTAGTFAIDGHTLAIDRIDVRELVQTSDDARLVLSATTHDTVLARSATVGGTIDAIIVGPLDEDPRIDATLTGFSFQPAPVFINADRVHVVHDLATGEGHVDPAAVSVGDGIVRATARWGPTWLDGDLAMVEPLDVDPWLDRKKTHELGRHVRGSVHVSLDRAHGDGLLHIDRPAIRTERLTIDAGTLVIESPRRARIQQLHYAVPGLEGTYDCTADLGPPFSLGCQGRWAGDARVLLRLRELDTW